MIFCAGLRVNQKAPSNFKTTKPLARRKPQLNLKIFEATNINVPCQGGMKAQVGELEHCGDFDLLSSLQIQMSLEHQGLF